MFVARAHYRAIFNPF